MLSNPAQYAYQSYDSSIDQTITFRPVVLQQDLSLIHSWMNQPHVVPFWNLAFDLERMQAHLEKAIADPHQTLYIGFLNNVPMSYWESYWSVDDILAGYYPTHYADQGIHLLIGASEFLGKGYALPLLRAMVSLQFQHTETQKIIAEPDIRNHKMIHVFQRCGFEFQTEIELPDKRAALMFCERQWFFRRSK
jgi:RimJ/RimL family protein N-acetyltransferase